VVSRNSGIRDENLRLQGILSVKNKRISALEQQVASLEEAVSMLKSKITDNEKTIHALQASSLDVLEDLDIPDDPF